MLCCEQCEIYVRLNHCSRILILGWVCDLCLGGIIGSNISKLWEKRAGSRAQGHSLYSKPGPWYHLAVIWS